MNVRIDTQSSISTDSERERKKKRPQRKGGHERSVRSIFFFSTRHSESESESETFLSVCPDRAVPWVKKEWMTTKKGERGVRFVYFLRKGKERERGNERERGRERDEGVFLRLTTDTLRNKRVTLYFLSYMPIDKVLMKE